MQACVELIKAPRRAAVLLHPLRLRLLEAFREPRSAAQVARELERPRQRLGHHVRALLRQGLLEKVGERRRGNFVEQLLQASAHAYVVAPQALGGVAADVAELRDRFSSDYLTAAAAGILRDVAWLRSRAEAAGKKLATLTLETEVNFRDAAAQAAFAEELATCLAELTARYHHAGPGRCFRFIVGGHPARPSHEESEHEETTF